MELTGKQRQLYNFAQDKHQNQKIQYTDEPFHLHLLSVAEIVSYYSSEEMEIEIALCHHLIEATSCGKQELALKLIELGYEMFPRNKILKGVNDLTTLYDDPAREAERIIDTISFSQTVRYADIIDNIGMLLKHDRESAKRYLGEVNTYLDQLDEGDPVLYAECQRVVKDAIKKMEIDF